jgi:hypothetical protein
MRYQDGAIVIYLVVSETRGYRTGFFEWSWKDGFFCVASLGFGAES